MILPIVVVIILFLIFAMYVIKHEARKGKAVLSVIVVFIILCIFGFVVYKSFFVVNTNNRNTRVGIKQYIAESDNCLDYAIHTDWNDYVKVSGNKRELVNERSNFGITVSSFQKDIDWAKVKSAGIEYAIIRVGYRGVETGNLCLDDKFKENLESAIDNGIDVGVYFCSQATSMTEVDEEIDFILKSVNGYSISYPIGIVLGGADNCESEGLTTEEYSNLVSYYAIRITEEGYTPMIYGTEEDFRIIDEYSDTKYLKWLFSGRAEVGSTQNCVIWQYRNYSSIDGIEGKVPISFSIWKEIGYENR